MVSATEKEDLSRQLTYAEENFQTIIVSILQWGFSNYALLEVYLNFLLRNVKIPGLCLCSDTSLW